MSEQTDVTVTAVVTRWEMTEAFRRLLVLQSLGLTVEQLTERHAKFKTLLREVWAHPTEPIYQAALDGAVDELFNELMEKARG